MLYDPLTWILVAIFLLVVFGLSAYGLSLKGNAPGVSYRGGGKNMNKVIYVVIFISIIYFLLNVIISKPETRYCDKIR